MSHLRRFSGPLIALSLIVPLLVLTAAPAGAQDDDDPPPLTVFVFANVMTNADRVGQPDEDWQVRVSIRTLSDCAPTRGEGNHDTYWIDAGSEAGARLSLEECVFSIAAAMRDASLDRDCIVTAQLAWGRNPSEADYEEGTLLTSSRPDGESRLAIRRKPGSGCVRPNRTHFFITGSDIVETLPDASNDANLLALAQRAAGLAEFVVRVDPDPLPDAVLPPGCDRVTTFDVLGNGQRVAAVVHEADGSCPLRASVPNPPAPFEAPEGRAVAFDGADRNILVDLSRLVRLRPARIAIIQNVAGSLNRGAVSYAIGRSCGDASTTGPSAGGATSPLYEGRFTVHGPHVPAFGATAVYPVGTASATSTAVVGCSVSVTISGVPAGCSVAGGPTQTLTWSADAPIEHFDFEFDVRCGTGATPAAPPPAPPTTPNTDPPAEDAELMTETDAPTGTGDRPAETGGPPRHAPTG